LQITAPVEALGDLAGDLNSRRGRIEGLETAMDGVQLVHAIVPLAEVMTYSRTLSNLTGGRGSFTTEFGYYEPVSALEQRRLVAAGGGHRNGHLN
jgi:elongation factor G